MILEGVWIHSPHWPLKITMALIPLCWYLDLTLIQNIYFWAAGALILLMKSAEFIHELVT